MSSEQALGLPVDGRADQYALGVIVYEMLGGRCPFEASTALESVQFHLRASAPPLPSIAPGVPATLVRVVDRMMSKAASDRFPDIREAIDALRAAMPAGWAEAHAVSRIAPAPREPSPPAREPEAPRRVRAAMVGAIAFGVLLALAVVVLLVR
jgi:serine/threonine-protein kinase